MMAGLLKIKTILNLVISNLLRLIFAVILFAIVVAGVIAVLSYQQWYPNVQSYIYSLTTFTATEVSQYTASSTAGN